MRERLKWWLWRKFRNSEARTHELNYLFWECTTRCNLACRHCGSDCKLAGSAKDMPLADFLGALDTIPQKDIPPEFTVVLTGGEPLLRPDIEEIGHSIRERGMGWSIVSNGWFYDEEMHSRLMSAGMCALTISLDGLENEHDWMRGRSGSFSKTLTAISIAAAEPRLNFDVVTCVNCRNLPQLEQIYTLLAQLGVKQWRLFTIIPIGRAASDADMQLDGRQLRTLLDFIASKRAAGAVEQRPHRNYAHRTASGTAGGMGTRQENSPRPEAGLEKAPMAVTFSCEGYLGKYETKVRPVPFFCHAGVNIASVLIDGRINACPNIDRDAFSQGSIYTDNFYEVWNTRFQQFRHRDWARRGKCKDCPVFANCQGGGMHNWHGDCSGPLDCHWQKTLVNQ